VKKVGSEHGILAFRESSHARTGESFAEQVCQSVARRLQRAVMWQVFKEFLLFLKQEKKWWLIPFVIILLLLGVFLIFSASSPLAPFLYPLF